MKMIPIKSPQEGCLLAKFKRPRNHGGEAALAASHAAGVAKMLLLIIAGARALSGEPPGSFAVLVAASILLRLFAFVAASAHQK
jgi:hypothetical protein